MLSAGATLSADRDVASAAPLDSVSASSPCQTDPGNLDHYPQTLELSFVDPAQAAGISVTVAPLWHDYKWAFTQRWDDNLVDSLRIRDLLERRHMHATFYLNASDAWYTNATHYPLAGNPSWALGKALLKGGNSVGGHTLTHNFVPDLNRQEIFWETLAVRIDREVNTQSPIDSFVFPFLEFRNPFEKEKVHDDIAAILLRDGYIHVADQYFNQAPSKATGLLDSWLLPCDGVGDVDAEAKRLLMLAKQRHRDPSLCLCMHAWPAAWGGPDFKNLDKIYRSWQDRDRWWYPNANELAAYRYQTIYGRLQARTQGASVAVGLERFEPWDLGASVPLTLKIKGAGPKPPRVLLEGRPLPVWHSVDRSFWLVDLPQSAGHGMPDFYDWHRNHSNRTAGLDEKGEGRIQGLASRLWLKNGKLHLRLLNRGSDLSDLRLRWRLPLGYAKGPTQRERLDKGRSLELSLPLIEQGGPELRQGKFYAAVQIDALRRGVRLRLYSDVRAQIARRDDSFPREGFLMLGPLPGDRPDFDLKAFARRVMERPTPVPCESAFADQAPCWQASPDFITGPLNPEIIPAGGVMAPRTFYTWDKRLFYSQGHKLHYLLLGDIVSPSTRSVRAVYPKKDVERMLLNGQAIQGNTLKLKAGENRLELLYGAHTSDGPGEGSFSARNYGPYFRLVDGEGRRLTDIEYRVPTILSPTIPSPRALSPTVHP